MRNIEPFWSGIFVTCARGKEAACRKEIIDIFLEYSKEFYGDLEVEAGADKEQDEEDKEEEEQGGKESIEDSIAKELQELRESSEAGKSKKQGETKGLFEAQEIGCECVIFVRTRRPIDPVDFVVRVCKDLKYGSQIKRSRYAQRLTPVTSTATANSEGLTRLHHEVLEPVFYNKEEPQTFAIRPTLRNHSTLTRDEIITRTARFISTAPIATKTDSKDADEEKDEDKVIRNSVDLKNYEKMVLVDCFKSSLGMAVVGSSFEKEYYRFNLEQIFTNKPSLTTSNPTD